MIHLSSFVFILKIEGFLDQIEGFIFVIFIVLIIFYIISGFGEMDQGEENLL